MSPNNNQAPSSIKGANAPKNATPVVKSIAVNLDWLRYSRPYEMSVGRAENLRASLPRHSAYQLTGEMLQNGKGYDSAMQLTIGVIHWHSERPEQGISVELSGSSLARSRLEGVNEIDILRDIAAMLGNVSTMDSAIDVYLHDADFRDILVLDELGGLETTVREVNEYKGRTRVKDKVTYHGGVYIGSPKSPKQITVYNKAAEQGLEGVDWTRIEMTWRGKHARAAHLAMLKFGIASVTQKAVKSMCNANIEWYQDAVNGNPAEIEPVRRPETNTVDWLINLTAPVLERELLNERSEGGTRLFDVFNSILIQEYTQRGRRSASVRSQSAKMRGMR